MTNIPINIPVIIPMTNIPIIPIIPPHHPLSPRQQLHHTPPHALSRHLPPLLPLPHPHPPPLPPHPSHQPHHPRGNPLHPHSHHLHHPSHPLHHHPRKLPLLPLSRQPPRHLPHLLSLSRQIHLAPALPHPPRSSRHLPHLPPIIPFPASFPAKHHHRLHPQIHSRRQRTRRHRPADIPSSQQPLTRQPPRQPHTRVVNTHPRGYALI